MANLDSDALLQLSLPDWRVDRQAEAVAVARAAYQSIAALSDEISGTLASVAEYGRALTYEAVSGALDTSRMSEARMNENLVAVREGHQSEFVV
jgi:hypothetical protein